VESVPEIAARVERLTQPAVPLFRQPAPQRRDADQDSRRPQCQAGLHGADHRDRSSEPEYILDGPARLLAIENSDGAFREIPDDRVGGL
jgi:hypothetical protein